VATTPENKPEDAQKQKFLEALERKNKGAHRPSGGAHGGSDKAQGEHGPEGGKRQFRRKSGG
jgi:hypothetical protein